MSGECTSQVTICEYQGTWEEGSLWGPKDPAVTLVHFLAALGGGSTVVSGGAGGGLGATCGLGGRTGSFRPSCSSIVTGGSSVILGSGQGPDLGPCSVSGSGSSSGSSSGCHTILKKTVESSLKTSITY